MGLTMGTFDIGHRELLRTCSEPDLTSLFRPLDEEPCLKAKVKSLDDMSIVNEEVRYPIYLLKQLQLHPDTDAKYCSWFSDTFQKFEI